MQIDDLVEVRVKSGNERTGGGGFPRANFTGKEADAAMVDQKLQPCSYLSPGGGLKKDHHAH